MITHIVLWTVHDRNDIAPIREQLEHLKGIIPEIMEIEVGTPAATGAPMVDISLLTRFRSWEDLALYQQHPEHQKVVAFLKPRAATRHVSDYETK